MAEDAGFAAALGELDEAHQIEHQRCRKQRITALPCELQRHRRTEKATKMDVVPGGFPVAQAADVFDRNERLRIVAEDVADELIFALNLGRLVGRVVEHLAVHVAEDVVADPAEHFEIPGSKHRGEHAFEQRFAGLAVLAGVAGFAQFGQFQIAGSEAPSDGVKLTYAMPRSSAAMA